MSDVDSGKGSQPKTLRTGTAADRIAVGDISGSVAAIGQGAQVIYQNVERALTQVEVEEKALQIERQRLAEAVTAYVRRLQKRAEAAREHQASRSPYKALLEYDIDDVAVFYGRSTAIEALLERLDRASLTVLHAESGAGKTSLLKAGIVPRLLAAGQVPLYVRPYQTPAQFAVKQALLTQLEQTPNLAIASLHDFMRQVADLLGEQPVTVILDQFEELFTVQSAEQRADFVSELAPCLDDDVLPVRWVFALRSEWFGQLGAFRPQIRQPYANEYLLRALSADEAREVIVQPARQRGVDYEPGLVDQLVADLGARDISPAHLQLVCSALFDAREVQPRTPTGSATIKRSLYESLGGTSGILRNHLDRVLTRDVPPEDRPAARHLLEALVTSDKRRALRSREDLLVELKGHGIDEAATTRVLGFLLDSRLLREDEIGGEDTSADKTVAYELAHDYLLEEIELDPAVQARKAAQELMAREVQGYKRFGSLLSADEVLIIEAQREGLVLSPDETALLTASQRRLDQERRRYRAGVGAVTIMVLVAVAAVVMLALALSGLRRTASAMQNASGTQDAMAATSTGIAATLAVIDERQATAQQAAIEAQQQAADAQATARAADSAAQAADARARARRQAIQSQAALQRGDLPSAYLYAINSYQTAYTVESLQALFGVMVYPLPEQVVRAGSVSAGGYSPDGSEIVLHSAERPIRAYNPATGETRQLSSEALAGYWSEFLPDGRRMVIQTGFQVVVLDTDSGEVVTTLVQDGVTAADASPDGTLIASGTYFGAVLLWDPETGEVVREFTLGDSAFYDLKFSPDGAMLMTATPTGGVRFWSAESGEELFYVGIQAVPAARALFTSDGQSVLTLDSAGNVTLWEDLGWTVALVSNPAWGTPVAWDLSPDDRWLALGYLGGRFVLVDLLTGFTYNSQFGRDPFVSLDFSPDSTKLMTTTNRELILWDVAGIANAAAEVSRSIPGSGFSAGTPDGRFAMLADGTSSILYFMDIASGSLQTVDVSANGVFLDVDSAGRRAALSTDRGIVQVWDIETGSLVIQIDAGPDSILHVALDAEGARVLTLRADNIVELWDVATGARLLQAPEPSYYVAEISPAGDRVITYRVEGVYTIWDAATGERLMDSPGLSTFVDAPMVFSPDGRYVVLPGDQNNLVVWDLMARQEALRLRAPIDSAPYSDFSADSRTLAYPTTDGNVFVVDMATGNRISEIRAASFLTQARFSPDGTHVMTVSGSNQVQVWDIETGLPTIVIDLGTNYYAPTLFFTPDGSHLVGLGYNGLVRVWSLDPEAALSTAQARLEAIQYITLPGETSR